MSEIGCDEWDLWLKAAPRKETSYLLNKDKQFKTSTAAFLTEGSIEFFIVPKKKKANQNKNNQPLLCLGDYAVQKDDEKKMQFSVRTKATHCCLFPVMPKVC